MHEEAKLEAIFGPGVGDLQRVALQEVKRIMEEARGDRATAVRLALQRARELDLVSDDELGRLAELSDIGFAAARGRMEQKGRPWALPSHPRRHADPRRRVAGGARLRRGIEPRRGRAGAARRTARGGVPQGLEQLAGHARRRRRRHRQRHRRARWCPSGRRPSVRSRARSWTNAWWTNEGGPWTTTGSQCPCGRSWLR